MSSDADVENLEKSFWFEKKFNENDASLEVKKI